MRQPWPKQESSSSSLERSLNTLCIEVASLHAASASTKLGNFLYIYIYMVKIVEKLFRLPLISIKANAHSGFSGVGENFFIFIFIFVFLFPIPIPISILMLVRCCCFPIAASHVKKSLFHTHTIYTQTTERARGRQSSS